MKNNWDKVRLGDIVKTSSGGTPSKSHNEYYKDGNIPWILSGDISQGLIYSANNYITQLGLENSSAKFFPKKTVLVAMYGATVGQVGILEIEATTNQAICGIYPNGKIDEKYLFFYFKSRKSFLLTLANGGAQPNISQEIIRNLIIPLPPIEVQRNIAKLLEKSTNIISEYEKILNKYDALIKSRFIEMFGDPVTNPKNWEIRKLSELAEYWNGLTYKPENVNENGTIVLRSSNIQDNALDFNDIVRVDCKIKEKHFVKNNDILMCSRNGSAKLVGKVALIKNLEEKTSFGAFMMIIRSNYHQYLFTYFQTDAFRRQIKTGATTTVNQITNNMLNQISIPLPPKELQNDFAAFVQQIDKSKFAVQKSLEKAETLYKSLMQEYFG